MRRFLGSERGEGRVGFLIGLVVLIACAYAAYVLVPIKVRTYEFLDEMRKEARFGAISRRDDKVHDRLIRKAKALGIPLDPKDLKIERRSGNYVITAHYEIPIDLKLYKSDWQFDPEASAPIF